MKILFTGGGTLGPVTPLLAVAEAWKKQDASVEFFWVGTRRGPERVFVEKEGIRFQSIIAARFVRHISMEWLGTPFRFLFACAQSYLILSKEKPDLIAAACGYTSVPIVIMGRMMGIPSWIHQSDVRSIMTNRLLAPFASVITVAWEKTQRAFPKSKTVVVGNPVRASVRQGVKARAEIMFGCDAKKPTIFIFGGGTGSQWINEMVLEILEELLQIANVIHVTGKGKLNGAISKKGYFVIESMVDEMPDAYAVADLVVSRAGAGAISELAALKKAAIIIPLPNSPQEDNAHVIHEASVVLDQSSSSSQEVLNQIKRLLNDPMKRLALGQRLSITLETNCAEKIVKMLGVK
ncbi:MAG: UDP-N-acetylglucosamine--N-acetylmuramyl-(pentapeptide) pyrophosphoryl-undecaprenol N-acetylglucosamine transferase [Candidatus Uhrbacteria bacterium]|nr:UDP-N-acetylglucosamine--N-acetylmuramyl-(pentapeptide) pyrophosphoryl-undecaprenol N-acetylglucosamine transferase [Candidatus Uhrbacteria bacterium]